MRSATNEKKKFWYHFYVQNFRLQHWWAHLHCLLFLQRRTSGKVKETSSASSVVPAHVHQSLPPPENKSTYLINSATQTPRHPKTKDIVQFWTWAARLGHCGTWWPMIEETSGAKTATKLDLWQHWSKLVVGNELPLMNIPLFYHVATHKSQHSGPVQLYTIKLVGTESRQ